ncbi:hypothetical protein LB504_008211 [Fusarium proliferatum]|nr:hypothetical protein LB504_008211 [Fusarium proliferatum]
MSCGANVPPPVILPPPPPPVHLRRNHGPHRRARPLKKAIYIALLFISFIAFIVMAIVVLVTSGYQKAAGICLGIDIVPSSPSSELTRLLEKNMTAPSRVRRSLADPTCFQWRTPKLNMYYLSRP